MRKIRIVEGTAEYIEEVLDEEKEFYTLDSLQFIYRSRIYNDNGKSVSQYEHAFYVAVLRRIEVWS